MRPILASMALVALSVCAGSTAAQALRGQYCSVAAPPGWAIGGETATRSSFGADFRRHDGAAIASYFVVGVAAEMRHSAWYGRFYATPEAAVIATLSKMGAEPVQCGAPSTAPAGVSLMQCRTASLTGSVSYQVQQFADGSYVLVMRTAGAPHGQWAQYGGQARTVASALRCNVPFLPSPPSLAAADRGAKPRAKGDADSGYSRWSGRENYHDPKTGENHWVEPGREWVENGPQGPGYYMRAGNEWRKLAPGRSN